MPERGGDHDGHRPVRIFIVLSAFYRAIHVFHHSFTSSITRFTFFIVLFVLLLAF
jgi:hypothetical protein